MQYRVNLYLFAAFFCLLSSPFVSSSSVIQVQPPSGIITLVPNVLYPYDPSDYVYSPGSTYEINGAPVGGLVNQSQSAVNNTFISFKMPEDQFGAWNLSMPAIFLDSNNTIYWSTLANKTASLNISDANSYQFNSSANLTCFDLVGIDSQTAVVDCAELNGTNITTNWLYTIDLTNQSVLATFASEPVVQDVAPAQRRITYYNFGDKAFIYRWTPAQYNFLEMIDASNPTAIVSYSNITAGNLEKANFSPIDVSVFLGAVYVSNVNGSSIMQLTYVDGDYNDIDVVELGVNDLCSGINAFYDIVYGNSGLTVAAACTRGLYIISWNAYETPYVAQQYSWGQDFLDFGNYSAQVRATQNFYYTIITNLDQSTSDVIVFLRKNELAFLFQDLNQVSGAAPYLMTVDTKSDTLIVLTNSAAVTYQSQRPVYVLNPKSTQTNLTFTVSIVNNNQTIWTYVQTVDIDNINGAYSGLYPSEGYNISMILSAGITQNVTFPTITSFSKPSQLQYSGVVNNFTSWSRTASLAFPQANVEQYNYIQPNSYSNYFFLLTQDDEQDAVIRNCTFDSVDLQILDVNCPQVNTESFENNILDAAFALSPVTQEFSLLAIIEEGDESDVKFFNATEFESIQTASDVNCQGLSAANECIFCINNQSQVLVWAVTPSGSNLDDTISSYIVSASTLGVKSFNPIQVLGSPYYYGVLFIQEAKDLLIVNVGFANNGIQVLANLSIPVNASFAVAENSLIISTSTNLYYYDLSNLRSPQIYNQNKTIAGTTYNPSTLVSSGSKYFAMNVNGQPAVFDSDIPDITNSFNVSYNTIASIMQFGDSDIIFTVDSKNNTSIVQVFHYLRFNLIVSNKPVGFASLGCGSLTFGEINKNRFDICVELLDPTQIQIYSKNLNRAFNLTYATYTPSALTFVDYISNVFSGPITGQFALTAEFANETDQFLLAPPITFNSTLIPFEEPGPINYVLSNDGEMTMLANNGTPYLISTPSNFSQFTSLPIALPTNDTYNYDCSYVNFYQYSGYSYVLVCTYEDGTIYLIAQSTNGTVSTNAVLNIDTFQGAYIGIESIFIMAVQGTNQLLLHYEITNQTTLLSTVILGNEFASTTSYFVDFDVVPCVGNVVYYRVFLLDLGFGIRSLDIFTSEQGEYVANLTSFQISTSPAFASQYISSNANWITLDVQNCQGTNQADNCSIILLQEYGTNYLIQWQFGQGISSILGTFTPYYDFTTLPSVQITPNNLYILAQSPNKNQTRFVSYNLLNIAVGPVNPYGAFETIPATWNVQTNQNSNLTTIDTKFNVNSYVISTNFDITFVGDDVSAFQSTFVNVTAFGEHGLNVTSTLVVIPGIPYTPIEPNTPGFIIGWSAGIAFVLFVLHYCIGRHKSTSKKQESLLPNQGSLVRASGGDYQKLDGEGSVVL
jgi:hypothetical protein